MSVATSETEKGSFNESDSEWLLQLSKIYVGDKVLLIGYDAGPDVGLLAVLGADLTLSYCCCQASVYAALWFLIVAARLLTIKGYSNPTAHLI